MAFQKLTKREFGTTSKYDLWNRIKELEDHVQCLRMDKQCIQDDLEETLQSLRFVEAERDFYSRCCSQKDKQIQFLLTQLTN